jgi:hypothetical protein
METYFAGLNAGPALKSIYFCWEPQNIRLSTLARPSEEGIIADLRNVMVLMNFARV